MSAQSWVETTVPPGYDLIRFRREVDGKTLEAWGGCCAGDQLVGPEPRDNPAAACRDMWRHWTASVLSGRGDVRAEDYVASGGVQWNVALRGGRYWPSCWAGGSLMALMIKGGGYCLSSYDAESGEVTCRYSDDVDEAMARFAALVLATEGMP